MQQKVAHMNWHVAAVFISFTQRAKLFNEHSIYILLLVETDNTDKSTSKQMVECKYKLYHHVL